MFLYHADAQTCSAKYRYAKYLDVLGWRSKVSRPPTSVFIPRYESRQSQCLLFRVVSLKYGRRCTAFALCGRSQSIGFVSGRLWLCLPAPQTDWLLRADYLSLVVRMCVETKIQKQVRPLFMGVCTSWALTGRALYIVVPLCWTFLLRSHARQRTFRKGLGEMNATNTSVWFLIDACKTPGPEHPAFMEGLGRRHQLLIGSKADKPSLGVFLESKIPLSQLFFTSIYLLLRVIWLTKRLILPTAFLDNCHLLWLDGWIYIRPHCVCHWQVGLMEINFNTWLA